MFLIRPRFSTNVVLPSGLSNPPKDRYRAPISASVISAKSVCLAEISFLHAYPKAYIVLNQGNHLLLQASDRSRD